MKKILSLALALTAIFSMLSFPASAEDVSADLDSTDAILPEVDLQSVQIAYDTPTAEERYSGEISFVEEQIDPSDDASSSDTTPPSFVEGSLSVSLKTATTGDTVTVRAKFEDESPLDEVWFGYIRPMTGKGYSACASFNSATGYWEVDMNITDTTQQGTWSLSYISVSDDQSNYTRYVSNNTSRWRVTDLSAADFEVINTASPDVTPPTIDDGSLSVTKNTAYAGDTVTVSVKFVDVSTVQNVQFFYLKPQSGSGYSAYASYNAVTGYWEMSIVIQEKTEQGIWSLEGISVEDDAGNSTEYVNGNIEDESSPSRQETDLSAANFEVVGTSWSADATPPSMVEGSLSVSSKTVTTGDKVIFRVKIEDDSTVETVSFNYDNPLHNNAYIGNAVYNADTGYWEASMNITERTQQGNWALNYVRAVNDQDKMTVYCLENPDGFDTHQIANLSIADFEVIESSSVIGDTSGDGILNVQDLTHYINCLFDSSTGCHVKSDFNGDGEINLADAIRLLRYIMDPSIDLYATT